jgi:hypothetical protein
LLITPRPVVALAASIHRPDVWQGWLESENRRERMFPRTFKMVTAKGSASRVLFGRLVEEMEAYQRKALGVKPNLGPAISESGAAGHAGTGFNSDVLAGGAPVIKVETAAVRLEVKEEEDGLWEWLFGPAKPSGH